MSQINVKAFREKVQTEEAIVISERRKKAGLKDGGTPITDSIALCLSGGGVRSATFGLGLLQALAAHNCSSGGKDGQRSTFLDQIDYVSSVSGGGYIASSLTWFMSVLRKDFPFGRSRGDNTRSQGNTVAWLRAHGRYLTPGRGLSIFSLAAAALASILMGLIVIVPPLLLLFRLLNRPAVATGVVCAALTYLGFAFVLGLAFAILLTGVKSLRKCSWQRGVRVWAGVFLQFAVILLALASVRSVYTALTGLVDRLGADGHVSKMLPGVLIGLSGATAMFASLRGQKQHMSGTRSLFLFLGLTLLVYGVFLLLHHLGVNLPRELLLGLLALSLTVAGLVDPNHASMHRFYRNRLMEAYMPWQVADPDPDPDPSKHTTPGDSTEDAKPQRVTPEMADRCLLKDIKPTSAPYQIINTTLTTTDSKDSRLRSRGGDSFVFSPLFVGSASTKYLKTKKYLGGNMNLATAFAISGAAVDPNTYATRSRAVSFLMTLLHIKLGYWCRNPKRTSWLRPVRQALWYLFVCREMLGLGLNEDVRYIHLSDGGHFENLGLYEMIRRKCRLIIVSDAGADPEWTMADLGRVTELVRVDFGVKIDIDTTDIRERDENNLSPKAYVTGTITYPPEEGEEDSTTGVIVYIKTTVIDGLPEDIYAYRRAHRLFPDQPTTDQFFDEAQFEAHRELGFQIGRRLCQGKDGVKLDDLIEQARAVDR